METGGELQGVQAPYKKNKSQTDLIPRTQKTARALRSGRFPLLRQAKDHLPI